MLIAIAFLADSTHLQHARRPASHCVACFVHGLILGSNKDIDCNSRIGAPRTLPGAWVQDDRRAGLPAHTISRVLVVPLVLGGQPHWHVLPPSKKPFLGRILGPAAAAPAGLEGAGLHDHLVLDGEPLTPHHYQDRQGARQFAVLLPDPKVAQGAPSPRRPDSPHCQLAEPGVIPADGCFRFLLGSHSHLDLAPQPLSPLSFVLSANFLLYLLFAFLANFLSYFLS